VTFDPYHKWLGIPPEEQPPTHYRLLGVKSMESDIDVIESAADQRMAHLRTFQGGPRADASQKLLNEVAAAKVCLCDPARKAAYDAMLRDAAPVAPVAIPVPLPAVSVPKAPARRKRHGAALAGFGIVGVLAVIAVAVEKQTRQAEAESEPSRIVAVRPVNVVAAAPATAALPVPPEADEWVDALAGFDPAAAAIDGQWRRVGSSIAMERKYATSRLVLPGSVAEEYDASFSFRRTSGDDMILVFFPVGRSHAMFQLMDRGKWFPCGFGQIQGKSPQDGNGTEFKADVKNGREYTLGLSIRRADDQFSVTATLNGCEVVAWAGSDAALSLQPAWGIPAAAGFAIGGFDGAIQFRRVTVRPAR
jgi:hypothetical protein